MNILPVNPLKFIEWWVFQIPKNIFITFKRIIAFSNNNISFTLNIKLLFTPLYGDYTIIGRLMGFIFRVGSIVLGLIYLGVLTALTLAAPLLWLFSPVLVYKYLELGVTPVILAIIAIFILWAWQTKDIPGAKLSKNKGDINNINKSFRPEVLSLLKLLELTPHGTFQKLVDNKKIQYLLLKAELLNEDFVAKFKTIPQIDIKKAKDTAVETAKAHGTRYIELEHLFFAILKNTSGIDNLLATYNSNLELVNKTIKWVVDNREYLSKMYIWQEDYEMPPLGGIGRGLTGRVTPLLDSISQDFTKLVKKGKIRQIIGRKEEVTRIAEILSGEKDNILIIGEPGSGKTSIVQGIAYEIIRGTKHKTLNNKRVVSVDLGGLLAGSQNTGQIAEKITKVMDEVKGSKDIILFIDEIHTLMSGGGDKEAETATIYSILEPYIAAPEIVFIGATSIPNYRKYIEPNGAFARLFQIVEIKESSKEDTLEILKYKADILEEKYKIFITFPALEKIVELSEKLIHERVLPDKAIDILNRAASKAPQLNKQVTSQNITKEISEVTHVPVENVNADEAQKLLNIETKMKEMVIGQDNAIGQIAAALKRARVGMRNEAKPIASFLFVGTTGVGKTQTAKALAEQYFGSKKNMIRLDMSEYQQLDSMNRLIGSPDGTVKGFLTESVRTSPFALILLDEIEKAHPNILLTFLQVLDDGRLTTSSGMTIDFTNTIIIATSNAGTKNIQEVFERGGSFAEMEQEATRQIREKFAPEFLNRFNGIIVFNPLSKENVQKITLLLLEDVKQAAEEKGVKLTFKPELVTELVKRGYSPEWGARPMSREIENSVQNYIANKILAGEIKKGESVELGTEVFKEAG